MGNSQSETSHPSQFRPVQQEKNYNYENIIHPYLRKAKLICNQQSAPILQLSISVDDFEAYQKWIFERNHISHPKRRFLYIPSVISQSQVQLCSQKAVVVMNCEFYPFCLDQEIEVRKGLGRDFKQAQIWYLMFTGLVALTYFQKMGKRIGNIGPVNILLNKRGHIRYINQFSWPNQIQFAATSSADFYWAPEEFQNFKFNTAKAECFCLGLIIAQLILVNEMSILYNHQNRFDFARFEDIRKMLLQNVKFSEFLIGIVLKMLDLDTRTRPNPSVILTYLSAYQKDILNFRTFGPKFPLQL